MNTPYTEWESVEEVALKINKEFEDSIIYQVTAGHHDENWLFEKIVALITSRDTYWKERIKELELSCVDDRLLGKSHDYLEGYNTSTERWREQRDALLDNLK